MRPNPIEEMMRRRQPREQAERRRKSLEDMMEYRRNGGQGLTGFPAFLTGRRAVGLPSHHGLCTFPSLLTTHGGLLLKRSEGRVYLSAARFLVPWWRQVSRPMRYPSSVVEPVTSCTPSR